MISEVDCNGDGIIDFCEFLKMMSRQSNPDIDAGQQLKDVFRYAICAKNIRFT